MKRRDLGLLALGGLTGWETAQAAPAEGRQYSRLGQPLPVTAGKVEVIEFFFYRCPHCFAFDPLLEAWAHQQPADVSLRRVPVGQQALLKLHQRMFYALEAMGAMSPTVHTGIFNAIHRQGVEANDEAGIVALVQRLGVDPARFRQAFNSFGVQGKLAQGSKLAELCGVDGVPALVVGGRFRTTLGQGATPGQSELVSGQQMLAVGDHLIKLARGQA